MDTGIDIELKEIGRAGNEVKGKVVSRLSVGTMGGTEEKYDDSILIDGLAKKFIERHPTADSVPPEGHENPLNYTIRGIDILQRAGIPTPAFYEGNLSGKSVLFSENVVANGGAIYGKSSFERLSSGSVRQVDAVFQELLDNKIHQVFGKDDSDPPEGSLWSWLIKANTDGVVLPSDDAMELLVRPDGTFTWMVLDPVGTRTDKELDIARFDVVDMNLKSVEAAFEDVYGFYRELKQRKLSKNTESGYSPPRLDI